jgi:DNA-binding NarL/FixJ family response regulator
MPNKPKKKHTIDQGSKGPLSDVSVFLVGDSPIVRAGLRRIVETEPVICVIGEASAKETTVGSISHYSPDLVLVDLDSHSSHVLECIGALHEACERLAILIIVDLADHELARKALTLGASGIVLKMQPPAVLIAAIRELCQVHHPTVISSIGTHEDTQTDTAVRSMSRSNVSGTMGKVQSLTARERDIIRLLGRGLKNKDIAHRLSISDITVRHHLTSIFCKLEVEDRQKLLILAHRYGLVEFGSPTEPDEAIFAAKPRS